ncbi:hypothetical protein E1B28_002875 [Marasmius oreades]|uniref:Uncharacterized protein n=1 Tax=Marasmius oreades TaxID=181124 RepID=A0A9P7UM43_9AGAR|nr:uncharacterized protein E1B28_002875 [Marasmius oreades]KAG7086958.1 hypothetical protein E1B28_002875 [Marasmius oreades]
MTTTDFVPELNATTVTPPSVEDFLTEYASDSVDFVFDPRYYETVDRDSGTDAERAKMARDMELFSDILDGIGDSSDTPTSVVGEENLPNLKRRRSISTGGFDEGEWENVVNDNRPIKKLKENKLEENDATLSNGFFFSAEDIPQENSGPTAFDEPVVCLDPLCGVNQSAPHFHPLMFDPSQFTMPAMGYQPLRQYSTNNFRPPSPDSDFATQRVTVPAVHRPISSASAPEFPPMSLQGYSASPPPCQRVPVTPNLPGPSRLPPISGVPSTPSQDQNLPVTISNGELSWAHPPASPMFETTFLLYQPPSPNQSLNQRPRALFVPVITSPDSTSTTTGSVPMILPAHGPSSPASSSATPSSYDSSQYTNLSFSSSITSDGASTTQQPAPAAPAPKTSAARSASQKRRLEKIPCGFCGRMITRKGMSVHHGTRNCQAVQKRLATSGGSPTVLTGN